MSRLKFTYVSSESGVCRSTRTFMFQGSRSHEVPAIDALQQHYDLIPQSYDAHVYFNVPFEHLIKSSSRKIAITSSPITNRTFDERNAAVY